MKILLRLVLGAAVCGFLLGSVPLRAAQTSHAASSAAGHFTPGYLGVYLRASSAGVGSGQVKGAEIMGVDRDAPAGRAGLMPHDVIVGMDGQPVTSGVQLRNVLHGMRAGQTIHLRVIRDGKTRDIAVTLASRAAVEASSWPKGAIFADGFPVSNAGAGLAGTRQGRNLGPNVKLHEFAMLDCDGLDVEPIDGQLAAYLGVPQGLGLLVRSVAPHSAAADAGLQAGDVITAANGMPSNTLRGWLMVISQNQGKAVKLKVIRNHKLKLIQYTPGGHRQQSRLMAPLMFQSNSGIWAYENGASEMSWVWTVLPSTGLVSAP